MEASAADAFLCSIEVTLEKGRGGPLLAQQRDEKAEEALVALLKRNESLTAESLARWEQHLLQDALLADVPPNASLEDIEALLARELGTGLNVVLVRMDGERIPLTLAPAATVRDLKQLIKRVMSTRLEKETVMGKRKISWKGVWTDFCLMHNGQRLLEDGARLCDVGVATNSDIVFARFNAKKAVKDARPRREKRPRRNAGDQ